MIDARRWRWFLLVLAVAWAHSLRCPAQAAQKPDTADASIWMTDLDKAVAVARGAEKPLLILFRCEP